MILKPLYILAFGSCLALGSIQHHHADKVPDSRPFYMGFSASPHELTSEAKEHALDFAQNQGDLIAEDFVEGVPWTEARYQLPLHPVVETNLKKRKKRLQRSRLFASISPLNPERTGLVQHLLSDQPDKWVPDSFEDPEAVKAYSRYALDVIRRFSPQYFAYALDVNMLAVRNPQSWNSFVKFAAETYKTLKLQHPDLPVFVTIRAGEFWNDPDLHSKYISQILPFSDYIAVGAYPYTAGHENPKGLPSHFFSRIAELAPSKPFAVSETGFPAELIRLQEDSIRAREEWQRYYLNFVLKESYRLNAEFVIWFHSRDFEDVADEIDDEKFGNAVRDIFDARKSNGLLDDEGQHRTSFYLWQRWAKLPVKTEDSK